MPRTVKDPEERRRELLACAMRLFAEEGYDNVSVRAVARAAHVAPGLAYHYFDSKERLFAAAIEDYARRCAEGVCAVLDEPDTPLDERIDRALETGARHGGYPYAEFFHKEGHGALHDRLSLAMCEAVRPHLRPFQVPWQLGIQRAAPRRHLAAASSQLSDPGRKEPHGIRYPSRRARGAQQAHRLPRP